MICISHLTRPLAIAFILAIGLSSPAHSDEQSHPAPDADLSAFSELLSDIAPHCRAATVGIVIPGGSMGSGVLINDQGLILTAAHVLPQDGQPIVIVLSDGTQLKGESLGRNDGVDSGMARIAEPLDKPLPYAPVAEAGTVWEGDWCVAFGHGGGVQADRPAPMRLGRALHVSSDTSATRWITTDCTVISGDSGGPLFDLQGNVIGIHSNISMSVLVNRHVPISAYHAQWDALSKPGTINAPPPPAEPLLPGLESLPDSIEREIARRLNEGDDALRDQLNAMRGDDGRIELDPERAAELFGRDDLLGELKAWRDKIAQRQKQSDKIKDAEAGGFRDDGQESEVSRRSRETRLLIIEKKRKRMLENIAQDLRQTHGKIAPHVLERFNPSASAAGPCTAQVLCQGEVVALATVVREDGYLVTKASELVGPPRVRLAGNEYPARVVNGEGENDLALLKIEVQGLTPVRWTSTTPPLGSLLVSPSTEGTPLAMSIIGVDARPIDKRVNNVKIAPPPKPYLGVSKLKPSDEPKGITLGEVVDDSPASRAGLQAGDIITAIDSQPIDTINALGERMKQFAVGQTLALNVIRNNETLSLKLELGQRPTPPEREDNAESDRRSAAQTLSARGGELSNRRTNFPNALTHDGIIWANDIGGPVLNLDGQAVGINIARYGRTATYALPAEHAKRAIEQMMPRD